jgi:predicted unusual protein kinase regulating ubiquinone biosynthesis (AarF/ABC1/UbiB family)
MSLNWEDARELVLAEHKKRGAISPTKRVHYYSKNLPKYNSTMKTQDTLITMAWVLESLNFIRSNKEPTGESFLLRKCRDNLVDLLHSESVSKNPDFREQVFSILSGIYLDRGEFWRAEWQQARLAKIKLTTYVSPSSDKSFFQFNSVVEDYLKKGEPYLAWQFMKLNSTKASHSESQRQDGELFLFSLFAPHEEVKRLLRQKVTLRQQEVSYCLLSLLSQGSSDWVNDSSLIRLIPKSKYQLNQILMTLIEIFRRGVAPVTAIERLVTELEEIFCLSKTLDSDARLLIFGSVLRILKMNRMVELHHLVEQRFVEVSLQLSKGISTDLFRFFETKTHSKFKIGSDSEANSNSEADSQRKVQTDSESNSDREILTESGLQTESKTLTQSQIQSEGPTELSLDRIPHKLRDRGPMGLSLTYDLAKILGPRRLTYFLTGQRNKVHLKAIELAKILKLINAKMSELKGPIMKIGQTLSYTQTSLPADVAAAFAQLPDQSQPLDFAKILEQVNRTAPKPLLEQIEFIDPSPLGVGSIGQVHQCHLKSGEIVAIKVKYPDIEKTVHSDFQLLKLVAKTIKLIHPRIPLEPYIRELESSISRECDYTQELASIERFYQRFKDDPHIVIPKPYRDYSSDGILVTSFETGLKFQSIADRGVQEKSLWAKSLVRFVVSSCRDGDFNTDPHPGNFLFRESQLVCLDFGSVNQWRAETMKAWNLLILACNEHNANYLSEALTVVNGHTKYSSGKIESFLQILTMHEQDGFWTHRNSQKIAADTLARQLKKVIQYQAYFRMPAEIIFGMRVYFGHLSIVSSLGVEQNWNDLVTEIMLPWKLKHLNGPFPEKSREHSI